MISLFYITDTEIVVKNGFTNLNKLYTLSPSPHSDISIKFDNDFRK